MRKITKRSAVILTAAVVAVGGAGAAWAVWLSTASGNVSGTAGSAGDVKVVTATVDGRVVPGNPSDVKITVKNENTYPVKVQQMAFGEIESGQKTCDAASTFKYNTPPIDLTSYGNLGAGETFTYTWANGIKLTADPDDNCQKAPFSFSVTVTAASAAE